MQEASKIWWNDVADLSVIPNEMRDVPHGRR